MMIAARSLPRALLAAFLFLASLDVRAAPGPGALPVEWTDLLPSLESPKP